MSNDLKISDSEKIARIRKESKIAKGAIFTDCICQAAINGAVIGYATDKALDLIERDSNKKMQEEIYGRPDISYSEKLDLIKKAERKAKIKKAVCYVAGMTLSFGVNFIKGYASGCIIAHEQDHMNKQIYNVVKDKNKTTEKGSK